MGVEEIYDAIRSSEVLDAGTKDIVIGELDGSGRSLDEMFESFPFKAPSAHDDWKQEIALATMGIIEPTLDHMGVPDSDKRKVYLSVYESIKV